MPRTSLTINTTTRLTNGLDVTAALVAADSVNGMSFDNTAQNVFIYIYNGDVGAKVLTVVTSLAVDGLALPDLTATIAAGERRMIGPFKNSYYGSLGSTVYLDIDSATSVTIGAFTLGIA